MKALDFDVADLFTRDTLPMEIRQLERIYRLEPSDRIAQLLAWSPEDEVDREIRRWLLQLCQDVINFHERARRALPTRRRAR